MSACAEGSSQNTRIEILRIKRGESIALQPHKTVMGVGHRELVLGASSTTVTQIASILGTDGLKIRIISILKEMPRWKAKPPY